MRTAFGLLALLALSCGSGSSPAHHRPGPTSPTVAAYAGGAVQSPSFAAIGSRPVLEAAMAYSQTAPEVEPPVSLTTSDGTGLRLVSVDANAVVEGPLAFTELHLVFENPVDRQIEGRFSITLPDEAAISRLAMLIDTGWQEAEVVERMAARRAYEDILHRRQDPALMEKKAGNQFRARIFPIPARGRKEIKISYSQQLASAEQPYTLPLVGWPELERLEVSVRRGAEVSRVSKRNHTPESDVVVSQATDIAGLRNGSLAVARVSPKLDVTAAPIESALILVDTSASRALGFSAYVERLGSLVRALRDTHGGDMQLRVACFDQGIEQIFAGPAAEFGAGELDAIRARRPLGASNLAGALAWAAETGAANRVIVVGDGIATAGATEGDALQAAVRALGPKAGRLDAVLTGGIRDEAMMKQLARGVLAHDGVVLDSALPAKQLAHRLSLTTVSGVRVAVEGARWVWPETIDGVQPGDDVLVYAELEKPGATMTVELSGPVVQTHAAGLTPVARPLLERAAAMARISRLEHQGDPKLREQIVALSTKHRVLSDHTALIVLETEQDYERFGIDRKALTDIMVVGDSGIELVNRQKLILAAPDPEVSTETAVRGVDKATGKEGGKRRAPAKDQDFKVEADKNGYMDDDGLPDEAEQLEAKPEEEAGVLGAMSGPAGARVALDAPATAAPAPPPAPEPAPSDDSARQLDVPIAGERMRAVDDSESVVVNGRVARPDVAAIAEAPAEKPQQAAPYSGPFGEVMDLIARGDPERALLRAMKWRDEAPGDVMALIALGEALEATGQIALAARAYGSVIDLYPSRADMRRFAGERLERLGDTAATLALDTYAKALAQRPDHPSSHRLLAYALLRAGEHADAFAALDAALSRQYPGGRFAGVDQIMRDDLALLGAAWQRAEPKQRSHIRAVLDKHGVKPATNPSTRFVLTWETDANDVDLHIYDAGGGHASYQAKQLRSGGELYADVTTGYGPEAFVIDGAPKAGPYTLQAHYYSRGPMGYGMGTLDVIAHDGKGGLSFEHHPFVVMNDSAYVNLATIK